MSVQPIPPTAAQVAPHCPFCGAIDCPTMLAALERGEFGWHPHTLTNRILPQYGPGLGEMFIHVDPRLGIRPRMIVSLEASGEEWASRLRRAATMQAAGAQRSGIVLATEMPTLEQPHAGPGG